MQLILSCDLARLLCIYKIFPIHIVSVQLKVKQHTHTQTQSNWCPSVVHPSIQSFINPGWRSSFLVSKLSLQKHTICIYTQKRTYLHLIRCSSPEGIPSRVHHQRLLWSEEASVCEYRPSSHLRCLAQINGNKQHNDTMQWRIRNAIAFYDVGNGLQLHTRKHIYVHTYTISHMKSASYML